MPHLTYLLAFRFGYVLTNLFSSILGSTNSSFKGEKNPNKYMLYQYTALAISIHSNPLSFLPMPEIVQSFHFCVRDTVGLLDE